MYMFLAHGKRRSSCIVYSAMILSGLWLGLGLGCDPTSTSDSGANSNATDGTGSGSGPATIDIISFASNFEVSALESPISVLYSVSTASMDAKVSGFFLPVADAAVGSTAIGDRVIVATDLPADQLQSFNFDPQAAGVGFYRVGIIVEVDGVEIISESSGVIQVQGPPDPRFIQPVDAVTSVVAGEEVDIRFDAGDPEGVVRWRLFFLREGESRTESADQIGTQLQVGSGNVVFFTFPTAGLDPGEYEIGVSAVDTGESVATTVAMGLAERIVTIPRTTETGETIFGPIIRVSEARVPAPPTLTFSNPGAADIEVFGDEVITIRFTAVINEPDATGRVEIFYDTDRDPDNGVTIIAANLSADLTSVTFDTADVAVDGTYTIGGTVRDGVNDKVDSYANGNLVIVRERRLTVLEPSDPMTIRPFNATDASTTVTVTWETNVPSSAGLVDVFAKNADENGDAFGPERVLLEPTSTDITTTGFSSTVSGRFAIFVRIFFNDATIDPLIVEAPRQVIVSTLPTVLWLGELDSASPRFDGAVFTGIEPEDNAGSAFAAVGDLNDDGVDEFIVTARYGKSFFTNTEGIGAGEAYLVFGNRERLRGVFNLNALGTNSLPGVLFTGIRTPQGDTTTDGLSSVIGLPDLDGDGRPEIAFGFPEVNSRGHNADTAQDGLVNPRSLPTLEKEGQFLRGGIVIVSSLTSTLRGNSGTGSTINLDLVGQNFFSRCVNAEPGDTGAFAVDTRGEFNIVDPQGSCAGTCDDRQTGGSADANESLNYGFVNALARDFFHTYVYSRDLFGGAVPPACTAATPFFDDDCLPVVGSGFVYEFCAETVVECAPTTPGLHTFSRATTFEMVDADFLGLMFNLPSGARHTGFYEAFVGGDAAIPNNALDPIGARIIGVGLGDKFGASITRSNRPGSTLGDLIVSAPGRTARGILLGPEDGPEGGGEISGLGTGQRADSGVAYMFNLRSLWTPNAFGWLPPTPHQYIVGEASHCSGGIPRIDNITATRIAGDENDTIETVIGIDDLNGDARDDFVVGAPLADRVYIAFRRDEAVEGDFVLEKQALSPNDAERLDGILIRGSGNQLLGSSFATGVDMNGDGVPDLVIGAPSSSAGDPGSVIVVFGNATQLTSGSGGILLNDLLATSNTLGGPKFGIRIKGNEDDLGGQFGFNVANAGDINGDGCDDLLIAAPGATPRYDPDPNDGVDELTNPGVDIDLDGIADNIDPVTSAGIVYVLFGGGSVTCNNNAGKLGEIPLDPVTATFSIGIDQLGTVALPGFIIAGRAAGDRIGGGDAGNTLEQGLAEKSGRGRSSGLASAGDVDGDGKADILIGSVHADPGKGAGNVEGRVNAGEAYLLYGVSNP